MKEKHRSGAKGSDAQASRTADDVAYTELVPAEEYEPGYAVDTFDEGKFFKFEKRQLDWLKEYAKDLDEKRACRELGLNQRTVERWFAQHGFKAEIDEIHNVWRYNIKMTAEHAAGRHLKLMEKFEGDYDGEESGDIRAKMMNPLSKMSETYLRAAGHFQHGGVGSGDSSITINIDLGADDKVRVTNGGEGVDASS